MFDNNRLCQEDGYHNKWASGLTLGAIPRNAEVKMFTDGLLARFCCDTTKTVKDLVHLKWRMDLVMAILTQSLFSIQHLTEGWIVKNKWACELHLFFPT